MRLEVIEGETEVICDECGGFMLASIDIAKRSGDKLYSNFLIPIWSCSGCQLHETVNQVASNIDIWNKGFSIALTAFYGQVLQHLHADAEVPE